MRHDNELREIRRLLNEERFAQAHELLARLTQKSLDDPQNVCDMHHFLRSAVIAIKARRVHYIEELKTLQKRQAYFNSVAPASTHSFDVTG
jgi:hypothetical protein